MSNDLQVLLVNFFLHAVANGIVSLQVLLFFLSHQEMLANSVNVTVVSLDTLSLSHSLEGDCGGSAVNWSFLCDFALHVWSFRLESVLNKSVDDLSGNI